MRTIKYLIKETVIALLLLMQLIVFFHIWQKYEVNTYFRNIDRGWAIAASYIIISVILMILFKTTEIGHRRLIDILFGEVMVIGITNILTYLQLCMLKNYPYLYSIKVIGLIIIIDIIISCIGLSLLQLTYTAMTPIQDAILIMNQKSELGKVIEKKRRNDKTVTIKEIYEIKTENIDEFKNIIKLIDNYKIVIIDDIYPLLRNNILKYCYEKDKKCYAISKTSDILLKSAKMTQLGYRSMTLHNIKQMFIWQSVVKRMIDVIISLIGIIILFPFFVVISICIKLTDNGPIIFKQKRYTKDGKLFDIYKFRSMHINTNHKKITQKNDSRITPIGKIIRRTHLDETPQLFNVLKGDMSIVGPRPEMKELFDKYQKQYPEYKYRLKMKAGITGYAQIYGKYDTSPKDKLKFDMIYICNYSVLLDLKLILLTFKVVFSKDTSEGVESGKTDALP